MLTRELNDTLPASQHRKEGPVAAVGMSIVVPARDEAATIGALIADIRQRYEKAEVIVVDDGSADDTGRIARKAGARVVRHPESLGNGAAVKSGARAATGEVLCFLDADGQHDPGDIALLLEKLETGYDMVIGARTCGSSQANLGRFLANGFYNRFASFISGRPIADLTSGFRVVRARLFLSLLHLLPNGFSYPTTITMAFLRSGYPVGFVPIRVRRRTGSSHIRPIRDGVRFLVIIFKIATLYAPLKIFLPVSGMFFMTGLGYYMYTYITMGRFTNMSMLIFSASVVIFLIGLISEQITALTYSRS